MRFSLRPDALSARTKSISMCAKDFSNEESKFRISFKQIFLFQVIQIDQSELDMNL